MSERREAFMRIIIGLVSGIIIGVWKALVQVVTIVHWFMVVFSSKRSKPMANFCNYWDSELYRYVRYMTFTTNERPFPFTDMKVRDKVDFKNK